MRCQALAALLCGAATLTAGSAPGQGEREVLYNRTALPPDWTRLSRAAGQQRTSFLLALRQASGAAARLEERLWQVSDPASEKYQDFLSNAEIDDLVRTPAPDVEAVLAWLAGEGVPRTLIEVRSDSVLVSTNISVVERLLATEMFIYVHRSGQMILRNFGAFSVPRSLAGVVEMTEGITDFPMRRPSARRRPEQPAEVQVVPESLAKLYSFTEAPVSSQAKQMPAEFQDDSAFSPSDLKAFFKGVALPPQRVSYHVGPFDDSDPDTEATLDVQYMTSVGLGDTNWYWTSKGWMYTFANNLYSHQGAPDVVSISWGWAESQQCSISNECSTTGVNSRQYVARVNAEFMKLGLRGISLFVSSGDSGANGRVDSDCKQRKLHASFPASSPYVTAVGATMLTDAETALEKPPPVCTKGQYKGQCASGGKEVAVSFSGAGFTSGGGFSNFAARPAYQAAVVETYLKSATPRPPRSYWNASGRAFPDVSAMGNNFLIYMKSADGWQPVGGTSASSPTWAGLAARLVDISLAKTGKPLGLLNPLLYKMYADEPKAFTDVTVGDNKCTEGGCSKRCKGFECASGWDPVTGLGTPVYDVMASYVSKMLEAAQDRRSPRGAPEELVV